MATATVAVPAVRVKKRRAVRLKNILLATDFSEHSGQALRCARLLAGNQHIAHVKIGNKNR